MLYSGRPHIGSGGRGHGIRTQGLALGQCACQGGQRNQSLWIQAWWRRLQGSKRFGCNYPPRAASVTSGPIIIAKTKNICHLGGVWGHAGHHHRLLALPCGGGGEADFQQPVRGSCRLSGLSAAQGRVEMTINYHREGGLIREEIISLTYTDPWGSTIRFAESSL